MKKIAMLFSCALILAAAPMFAASNAFLKIEGLDGGSKDPAHRGWIELQSVDVSALQAPRDAATGQAAGKRQWKPIRIVKEVDAASPKLYQAALTSQHFSSAVLEVNGQHYSLQGIAVQGVQKQPAGRDTHELEQVAFTFERISEGSNPDAGMYSDNWGSKPKPRSNGMMSFTGGLMSPLLIQDVRLIGPTQAIIAVCEPPDPALNGLRLSLQTRRRLPTLTFTVQELVPAVQFNFTDVLVTGMAPAAGGCTQMSLSFTRYQGPPSGFHAVK